MCLIGPRIEILRDDGVRTDLLWDGFRDCKLDPSLGGEEKDERNHSSPEFHAELSTFERFVAIEMLSLKSGN